MLHELQPSTATSHALWYMKQQIRHVSACSCLSQVHKHWQSYTYHLAFAVAESIMLAHLDVV